MALTAPPSSQPRTISELISTRAGVAPNQPILGYPTQGIEYVQYTYAQIDDFINTGVDVLGNLLPLRKDSAAPESVVAILGPSTLDYFVTALALSRLGFSVLFLSTRISVAAYVSLLKATGCSKICRDPLFHKTVSNVEGQMSTLHVWDVLSNDQYQSLDASCNKGISALRQRLNPEDEKKKISWIIHSSGSTGLPKPIFQTHEAALHNYQNNMNMDGFVTLPLFHAHGLSSVLRGFTSYNRIFMYNAGLPLTRSNLVNIMQKYNFEIFYGVPYALKLLSETTEGIQTLAKFKVVMFGGSACPDGLGDRLVEHGVNLISHYGTTETGQLMTSFRPCGDKAWNFVRVHAKLRPFVRFEQRGGGLFELIVLDGWPSKVATNREDGSYATKDLFEQHPTTSDAWKYAGRLDDTIVLLNGEKAIPIAMEMAVRHHPLVKDAVMFGTGKASVGLAVIASDAAENLTSQELLDNLWPLIDEENRNSPTYAQVIQDMIMDLPASTAYPQTDKGTLIRQAFYKEFAKEIEALYQRLEANARGTLVVNENELRVYLRKQILRLSPEVDDLDLRDDTDLFSLGLDSLQSSVLRGKILQDIQLNGNQLPQNIVFEQPTLAKLARTVIEVRDGVTTKAFNVEDEMAHLVEKYGHFPQHIPVQTHSLRKVVIVTGATGSLGAHVVAQLVVKGDISEVCCLVRTTSQQDALARVFESLDERAILQPLSQQQRQKISAYSSELCRADLGLSEAVYNYLTKDITSLIHCAWSVNFNKHLSSFEDDGIGGVRNLILLCLSAKSPKAASFNFCSSVSTVARTPGPIITETLPPSFSCAQGMGYAQSKLVAEHIVDQAAKQTGINARVLRIGQIVADQINGIWNNTEAIPLMLQAAVTIGALPTLDERPRWLPVDVVANAVNDISLSDDGPAFFNIVNPKTFHWSQDLLPCIERSGLSFQKIPQQAWIQRLRESNPDVARNPTFKLLEFFVNKYDHDKPTRVGFEYETKAVKACSSAISNCPALSDDLVNKFTKHFLATSWKTGLATSTVTESV